MSDDASIFNDGFKAGRASAAGIAQRLCIEIRADLAMVPRGFRSSARMRAIAEMFEGLAELIESDDPGAVDQALADLRKGFGYVAKKDGRNDWAAFLDTAGTLVHALNKRHLKKTRNEIDQALDESERLIKRTEARSKLALVPKGKKR